MASRKCATAFSGRSKASSDDQPEFFPGWFYFFRTERRAVSLESVLFAGGAVADMGSEQNERRPVRFGLCAVNGLLDCGQIVPVIHRLSVPVIRFESFGNVFRERQSVDAARVMWLLSYR